MLVTSRSAPFPLFAHAIEDASVASGVVRIGLLMFARAARGERRRARKRCRKESAENEVTWRNGLGGSCDGLTC